MRKALNTLYKAATALAACCLLVIATLVALQVLGRIADYLMTAGGFEPLRFQVPSLAEIAGFLLVGASFLALAGTLRNNDHIRVNMLLQAVPAGAARLLNIWVIAIALVLAAFFTWNAAQLALDSYKFNETSYGVIPVPLVYPQAVMTLGLLVFAISLLDDLIVALMGRAPSFETVVKADPIEGKE
ncbi:TRAP transporter small permease [Roseibium sediminicola]|uniref:TRAP transporter small permease protein n=1 Tax=Roseibium sediminicola TaxID=2933272 RepID=A0ABT0GXP5_9HYPH|nr:TRAP transporter small permease [Roseibium sp. CAU 1639]MCK7613573.1 TRAP transporter small permease [Roseibium sp. CAU 1639]